MKLNLKFPLRQKYNKEPVTLISAAGRTPGYPILGYIGEDKTLHEWDEEGVGRFGGNIENMPVEYTFVVVLFDDGTMAHFSSIQDFQEVSERNPRSFGSNIISVKEMAVPVPLGVRDDATQPEPILEQIVDDFNRSSGDVQP